MIEDYNLTLSFERRSTDFLFGMDDPKQGRANGVTSHAWKTLWVLLNTAIIAPLFRDDLDDFEKRQLEWIIANTLLHEMTVSPKIA